MSTTLRLFLIAFFSTVLFVAGCSGGSDSGVNKDPAPDIDGDGIADIVDPDIDGDGIPNGKDPDDDNDGIEDTVDPTPPAKPSNQTCTHADIRPPSDEASFGDENASLGWDLLPKGCVVPLARSAGSGLPVTAKNTNRDEAPSEARATYERCDERKGGVGVRCEVPIKIPDGCGDEKVEYEIEEIKDFLQDSKGLGKYSQKVSHKGEECPDGEEPLENPKVGNGTVSLPIGAKCFDAGGGAIRCESGSGQFANCGGDPAVYFFVSNYSEGLDTPICKLDAPTWSLDSGTAYIRVTLAGGKSGCAKRWSIIRPGDKVTNAANDRTWEQLQEECSFATVAPFFESGGSCSSPRSIFTLKIEEKNPTIRSFSAGRPASSPNCPDPLSAPDSDGDGIPNGSDPDVDGDGIPNTSDKDIDGDGIENKNDPDIDGDGIKNGIDKDSDGDGTPDAEDETPGGPR